MGIFLFSDYFPALISKGRFIFIIASRFIKILFRRRKSLEVSNLHYYQKHQFDDSYFIIHYRFRNALWYRFDPLLVATEKNVIIFDVKNICTTSISLTAYGFFRKKTLQINFQPQQHIQNGSFKIRFKNLNANLIFSPKPTVSLAAAKVSLPPVNIYPDNISIQHSIFNLSDFI